MSIHPQKARTRRVSPPGRTGSLNVTSSCRVKDSIDVVFEAPMGCQSGLLRINPRAASILHRPRTREHEIRAALPYGCWLCRDGRQVLFNRDYLPIWERPGIGHQGVKADPYQWIHWIGQCWYFDDGCSPLSQFTPTAIRQETLKLIDAVLRAWGLRRAADNRSVARVVS
jgi:hypothetical protein